MIMTIIFLTFFTTFTASALPQLLPAAHSFTPVPLSQLPARPYIPKEPKPLCKSQLNLANYACGLLPYATLPPPSPPPPRRHHHHHSRRPHRHGRHHPPPPHHRRRHPPPPPLPHADDDEDDDNDDNDNDDNDYDDDDDELSRRRRHRRHRRRHHHHRSHRHGHHSHNQGTPAEQECCRWLRELDSECVCSLMYHLPPFMIKPVHQYTVRVDSVCHITYSCSSAL